MTMKWPKAEHGYLIDRTDYPLPIRTVHNVDGYAPDDSVWSQDAWAAVVPHAYRLLAAPRAGLPYPKPPWSPEVRNRADLPGPATVYWTTLLHVLMYSFGWSRPDLGLKWWADAGRPVDDHRLRLIAVLWGADGHLDQFLAWLWTSANVPVLHEIHELTGHHPDGRPVQVDEAWLRSVTATAEAQSTPGPLVGGTDPLHLDLHADGPVYGDPGDTALLYSSTGDRRAVFLVDRMTGWYRALTEQGANLPDIGDHSWYVDVVVKPVGHLGTYRRSRETGLWFSGPHSLHVRGV